MNQIDWVQESKKMDALIQKRYEIIESERLQQYNDQRAQKETANVSNKKVKPKKQHPWIITIKYIFTVDKDRFVYIAKKDGLITAITLTRQHIRNVIARKRNARHEQH